MYAQTIAPARNPDRMLVAEEEFRCIMIRTHRREHQKAPSGLSVAATRIPPSSSDSAVSDITGGGGGSDADKRGY